MDRENNSEKETPHSIGFVRIAQAQCNRNKPKFRENPTNILSAYMRRAREGCKRCKLGPFYNPKILAGRGILLMAKAPRNALNALGGRGWAGALLGRRQARWWCKWCK